MPLLPSEPTVVALSAPRALDGAPQPIDQRLQRRRRRGVRLSVDALRPEVALESCDHLPGLAIVDPGDLHPVP